MKECRHTKEEFRLECLSRHRFEKQQFDKAILVTGATENHAYHLPMGTDTFAAYGVAQEVARKTPGALLLPPIHFGVSDGLMPYPFTITLTAETLSLIHILTARISAFTCSPCCTPLSYALGDLVNISRYLATM